MSQRFRAIQRILGVIIVLSSLTKLLPGFLALAWDEEGTAPVFFGSFLASSAVGLALWLPVRHVNYDLRLRDGFLIVTFTWIFASLVSALPFVHGPPHLSYTDAIFEATSGLTTTGATVIVGLDALPASVQFYRQLLQFLGGMGIVILAVAILPMLKIGGTQLFRAESTGPTKDTKLTPRIAETAKALWAVYFGLTVLCAISFWFGGMTVFEAINHAMSTVSTGGFSTYDAAFGVWDSPILEWTAVAFMLLGGVNFGLHFVAWRRASVAVYSTDSELRSFIRIVIGASLLWIGWFGFNAGSALESNAFAALAFINTFVATAAAGAAWAIIEQITHKKPSLLGGVSGVVAGLVAITPAAGFAHPGTAIILGAVASVICYFFVTTVKNKLGYDDSLDVFGIHAVGGIVGAIGTGIVADPALGGQGWIDYTAPVAVAGEFDMVGQVITQCWAVGTTVVWTGVVSAVLFLILKYTLGLRPDAEAETNGLDISEHGERAYN